LIVKNFEYYSSYKNSVHYCGKRGTGDQTQKANRKLFQ